MTLRDPADLLRVVRERFEPVRPAADGPGAVGVELELIPHAGSAPAPDDDALQRMVDERPASGRFSFEPGGQLEYSTPALPGPASLAAELGAVLGPVVDEAARNGIDLSAVGLATRFGPEEVGLRRATPRYVVMDRYFARLGPWGSWMMRCTASLQINLDLGPPRELAARWRVANLAAPLLVAVFANSAATLPGGTPVVSGRAWIWRHLDPGRTGTLGRGPRGVPPWAEYMAFALRAPVMFDARTRPVLRADGGVPRFSEWWADPAAAPTVADWEAHLGTLFPDVRPRGWLEVRVIDVPERPWWSVPPAVLAALLYDHRARSAAEELLSALYGSADDLGGTMERALRLGLADGELRAAARALFGLVEAALRRWPADYVGPTLRDTEAFRERYVEAGRTQADEARERGAVSRLGAAPRPAAATGASLPPRPS